MVVVWRLQTLAAASGLHVDVPNPIQRNDWSIVKKMIEDADSVIALITKQITVNTAFTNELTHALGLKKRIIPIVEEGIALDPIRPLIQQYDTPIFLFNRQNPWLMETQLADYLKKQKESKDNKNALLALAGTIFGLFLLDNLSKD